MDRSCCTFEFVEVDLTLAFEVDVPKDPIGFLGVALVGLCKLGGINEPAFVGDQLKLLSQVGQLLVVEASHGVVLAGPQFLVAHPRIII